VASDLLGRRHDDSLPRYRAYKTTSLAARTSPEAKLSGLWVAGPPERGVIRVYDHPAKTREGTG
jgi:hypothetical protein